MPTNLVASLSKLLTPELLSSIASALGLDRAAVQKAATASVPALLAALASLVSKPGGPAKLRDAVTQQQPGISLADVVGAAGQNELIDRGLGTLSSLLGGGTVSALGTALSKYSGVSEGGSKGLLGVLAPLLMGVLGQQQRAGGLDAAGLAQLIQSQKDNIVSALPSGLADYLKGTGILDAVMSPTAKDRVAKDQTWAQPDRSSSQWGWTLPVLGILAIGALAWYLFAHAPAQSPGTTNVIVAADQARDLIGRPVYSSDNKKIGEILEFKLGPDNKVTDVFVDTGTFLGVGATRYRVASDQIEQVRPDSLVLTIKESDVKTLPQADEKQAP